MRTQVIALTAAALNPAPLEVLVRDGASSLRRLFDVRRGAGRPELFCLDLYKRFDIDTLASWRHRRT
jgi:hypothetical protein